MDPIRFARVQSLFSEALTLPEQDRTRFLNHACEGDMSLFSEVAAMLEEDHKGGSLLDEQIADVAHRVLVSEDETYSAHAGPYRLIKRLGEGGMGTVYLAERSDVGNPVAIKFLRDAGLSPARRERFLSEQRLLAPLNHLSIARFYDAGTLANGTPWFAMEYVEGLPVTEYCRLHRSSIEQRLRLFCNICEAVQYAHEHAVIHRDLKPSNILVKDDGSVRLLDFGIAKQMSELSEPVDQTQTGLRFMTPAYAAPEQVRGEAVGVFTDVYALGIILYELLTGQPPFDLSNQTPGSAERMIVEDEPTRPSVRPSARGVQLSRTQWLDLDVLCLTAIHKDSQRRYRSVEAITRDVDRFLKDEPLQARPDNAAYKAKKFLRRNRRPVIATAAMVLLLVFLLTIFLVRLTRARNEALMQASRSERIKDFMQHLFNQDAQTGPSIELRAVDLLDRGAKEAGRLDREPEIKAELLQILGQMYDNLEKFDRAHELLSSAVAIRSSVFGVQSKEVAESLISLGAVRAELGETADGVKLIRRGLAIDSKLLSPEDFALASGRMELGRALVRSHLYPQAITELKAAAQVLSRPQAPQPDLFLTYEAIGTAYTENGQYQLAEAMFTRALAVGKPIYKKSSPMLGGLTTNLGSVEFSLQHFSAAERYYRVSLEATEAWYGPDNARVATESRLLGQSLLKLGRLPEAETYLRRALAIHEKLPGNLPADSVQDLNALALAAQQRGHLEEAKAYLNRMLAIETKRNGGKDPAYAIGMNNLANIEREQKQYASAEALSRKALATIQQVLPADHLYVGVILLGLGKDLMKERRFREAEPYLVRSYSILGKQGNPSMETLQKARAALAEDYAALEKPAEAHRLQAEASVAVNH